MTSFGTDLGLVTQPASRPAGDNPLQHCRWIELPVVHEPRGNLSFIEGLNHVPFDIRRIYYLYDVPSGAERAGHAHRNLTQLFISMSGSFDLVLEDGTETRIVHLNRSHRGYLIAPWVWRTVNNFSGNSVCLVLASEVYQESDYIRDHGDFHRLAGERRRCQT
jgi:hypothetical protein